MVHSFNSHYSIEDIKKIVTDKNCKIVSFDLFDTLLVRPSMKPTDIFYLLEKVVFEKYNRDFVALRENAEIQMKKNDATICEIWDWICKTNHLPLGVANQLMQMEIELEEHLLYIRPEMIEVLKEAKNSGKRVIIISDMYMGSDILSRFLKRKGICGIDKVYVSCDYHARKSDGELYSIVIEQEGISDYSEIVHIGDNYQSDYVSAINKGITAVYYPSIWDDAFAPGRPFQKIIGPDASLDPYARLQLSFAVFYTYLFRGRKIGESIAFNDLEEFCSIYLANILVSISLDLLFNHEINEKYDTVFFAARDGYLPYKIFNIFEKELAAKKSIYFQSSRLSMSFLTYNDFFDYFDNIPWSSIFVKYELKDFIKSTLADKTIANSIISSMSDAERKIDLSKKPIEAREVLIQYSSILDDYFSNQKRLAIDYYKKIFSQPNKRYLVFDCGYSGSVSSGLMKIYPNSETRFDKYYIWETQSNKEKDAKAGTITYCLSNSDVVPGENIILEECFSPLEGTCVGFINAFDTIPVQEIGFRYDEKMHEAMDAIQSTCEEYTKSYIHFFGPYLDGIIISDRDVLLDLCKKVLISSPYMEASLFKPIKFTDTLNGGVPIELSKKVYDTFQICGIYNSVFDGTLYKNPNSWVTPQRLLRRSMSIGIHFHIHYVSLIEEFICYLKDFPVPFDLIVTTTQEQCVKAIENLCCSLLHNLCNLYVIPVENRGRDIAPWVVSTAEYQSKYELFCHVHGKFSLEYDNGIGNTWRKYLFDNLISSEAVSDIINTFSADNSIGCLFPDYYSEIKKICISENIPLIGEFGEQKIIEELMDKMNLGRLFSRDDLFYSAGTMFWYRPKALQPLFEIGLSYNDFPAEPIPNGGTIAHAIERLPGLLCREQGFRAVIFNEYAEREIEILEKIITVPSVKNSVCSTGGVDDFSENKTHEQCIRTWKGQTYKWYVKKIIKSIFPYGVIRIWQRIRYHF